MVGVVELETEYVAVSLAVSLAVWDLVAVWFVVGVIELETEYVAVSLRVSLAVWDLVAV